MKAWRKKTGRSFRQGSDGWWAALHEFIPYRNVRDKAHDFLASFDLKAGEAGGDKSARVGHSAKTWADTEPSDISDVSNSSITRSRHSNAFAGAPLIPNNPTSAQKQYLLETEWAQQAFLTSYTIAVIDNAQVFKTVHTVNFAALSSRYMSCLRNHAFWAALPNLHTLKIMVSADWRDVFTNDSSLVDLPTIYPVTVVATFRAFLQMFISPLESIKSLSLGWVDGGEHATGIFARNQHVLCAPIDSHPAFERPNATDNTVLLPHVTHLTLNNCWITPSGLESFVHQHKQSLQVLNLNSISLSAPTETSMASYPSNLAAFWDGSYAKPPAAGCYSSAWLASNHLPGSWPRIIGGFTPGPSSTEGPDAIHTRQDQNALWRIEFHSCGYIMLGYMEDFGQDIFQYPIFEMPQDVSIRKERLRSLMMFIDAPMLGKIIPFMPRREVETLSVAWNMSFGWGDDPSRLDNLEDGQPEGGSGRFSGCVERADAPLTE